MEGRSRSRCDYADRFQLRKHERNWKFINQNFFTCNGSLTVQPVRNIKMGNVRREEVDDRDVDEFRLIDI